MLAYQIFKTKKNFLIVEYVYGTVSPKYITPLEDLHSELMGMVIRQNPECIKLPEVFVNESELKRLAKAV